MVDDGKHFVPVKLPNPPSSLPFPSVDVHIRWLVDSGCIVQKGEKIAHLFYSPSRTTADAHVPTASDQRLTIRARVRKRGVTNISTPTAITPTSLAVDDSFNRDDSGGLVLEIRSPSSGFLNIVYKHTIVNDFHTRHNQTTSLPQSLSESLGNLILAAVEPCEHPAVVGGLCAVCGADTRKGVNDNGNKREIYDPQISQLLHWEEQKDANKVQNELRDAKWMRGIEHDVTMETAKTSKENGYTIENENHDDHSSSSTRKAPTLSNQPLPSIGFRSLSSLLSGVKTTHGMQQSHRSHPRPLNRGLVNLDNAYSNTGDSTTTDSKMTQMTVAGGVTLSISESEAKSISEASSKKLIESKQLCLVLDLDHTLLHATDDFRAGRFVADEILVEETYGSVEHDKINEKETKLQGSLKPNPQKRDDVRSILLPMELPPASYQQYLQQKRYEEQYLLSQTSIVLPPIPLQKPNSPLMLRHYVKLRPHLKEFFQQIQSTYKLSVYTAGTRAYAEQIAIMICRHLVGSRLDEEGLNTLRMKVQEKEKECKQYHESNEILQRNLQLELAKEKGMGMDVDLALELEKENEENYSAIKMRDIGSKSQGATVSFAFDKDDNSATEKFVDSTLPNKLEEVHIMTVRHSAANSNQGVANADTDGLIPNIERARDESDCSEKIAVSSSIKEDIPHERNDNHIPRKKLRKESSSLISLLAPSVNMKEKDVNINHSELSDPSNERDKLRNDLNEAEKLEIDAIELRRKLFGSRIVSRTDVGDLGTDVKSLKRVFPCGGIMACIIDDREDVWANAKNNDTGRPGEPPDNLLLVQPYHWMPFSGYRDVNNASGLDPSKNEDEISLINNIQDDKEEDMQLLWTADVLRRLHDRYYDPSLSAEERSRITVPSLLRSMRSETLSRTPHVRIVFSGVIPICQQNIKTDVRLPLIRYAEELGAKVQSEISKDVTHVVARRDGSEKIRRARKIPGCFVVQPSWLMECYWSITHRNEGPHHMGPMPKVLLHQHTMNHSKILLGDSDDNDESLEDDLDDCFVTNLESDMLQRK